MGEGEVGRLGCGLAVLESNCRSAVRMGGWQTRTGMGVVLVVLFEFRKVVYAFKKHNPFHALCVSHLQSTKNHLQFDHQFMLPQTSKKKGKHFWETRPLVLMKLEF